MDNIQILSLIYGAAGVLGTAYLCVAMGSGLLTHKHHGHGSGHGSGHLGGHASGHSAGHSSGHGGGHGPGNRAGHGGQHGGHPAAQAGSHTANPSARGAQGHSGNSKTLLSKIEHSAHMHLPHFHTHHIWPAIVDYFNPTSVAIMFSMGGMFGFLCLQLDSVPKLLSLPCAIVVGLIARKVFFNLLEKFSEISTVSTAVSTESAIGGEATICLPVSDGRIGEVFYEIGGKRFNAPARADVIGSNFGRGQKVWVTDIKEGVFIVMDVSSIECQES